jgi:hypothetical protein
VYVVGSIVGEAVVRLRFGIDACDLGPVAGIAFVGLQADEDELEPIPTMSLVESTCSHSGAQINAWIKRPTV